MFEISEFYKDAVNIILYYVLILFKELVIIYLLATTIDFWVCPSPIGKMPLVHKPIPLINGLDFMIPKAIDWQDSPALKFWHMASTYGDVYQMKIGTKLVVVANSADSIQKLWCEKNVKGNNSRPITYSFHKILSKGIYTIGTTPMGETYKKARKHVSEKVLSEKRNKDFNYVIMDRACDEMIERIKDKQGRNTNYDKIIISSDFLKEAQYFHLQVALWLTYGYEFNPDDIAHRYLGDQIIECENKITKVRSHVQNAQDYLPSFLKFVIAQFSKRNLEIQKLYSIRQKYLKEFHDYVVGFHRKINDEEYVEDSSTLQKNKAKKLEHVKTSLLYKFLEKDHADIGSIEITSECLTMISAGLDNTPLNFKFGLHMLVNYHPDFWEEAYNDILQHYDDDSQRAYKECSIEMKSEFVKAIVEETLRHFSVLPMSLPREATCDLVYRESIIPKGTILFLNCYAGNHDSRRFPKPNKFAPSRWLKPTTDHDGKTNKVIDKSLKHFAFGVGSRKCLGGNFATRELYILFAKMILTYKPAPQLAKDIPPDISLALNMFPESLAIETYPFEIQLEERTMNLSGVNVISPPSN